ncbi:Alkaline phosphatase [Trinorchestia longiramus]|nr:Alkaline phosphatase [Trinorchestia longiramus]
MPCSSRLLSCLQQCMFIVSLQLLIIQLVYCGMNPKEKRSSYWYDLGLVDIQEAVNRVDNTAVAKNVILFVGDGLGVSTMTAGRIFKGQKKGKSGEEGYLSFDRFPNVGLLKTYNVDKQVPDSSATGTAFLSGVKGNYYTLGVTAAVKKGDCPASLIPENKPKSILTWAQEGGKETGLVTTTRITHATPGASYAASAQREWECDSKMLEEDPAVVKCKDIARQLVEDLPGQGLKVIFGGGRVPMGAQLPGSTSSGCRRADGRNLAHDWQNTWKALGSTFAYVTNTRELKEVDTLTTEHIMGLFADSHLSYERDRDRSNTGHPSLSELTTTAIKRLRRAQHGFLLVVEGGRIDHALHDGKAQLALEEVLAFDEAVKAALDLVDLSDTLVIVTADHSHGLTINGYPDRGNDILGTTSYSEGVTDNLPYTTLMFTSGPGYNVSYDGTKAVRANVSGVDTHSSSFMFPAAVPTKVGWSMHSGEDVVVHAAGPWSHLFHRTHEQTYVAHVIAYAAQLGPFAHQRPLPSDDFGTPRAAFRNEATGINSALVLLPHLLFSALLGLVANWLIPLQLTRPC